MIKGIGDNYKIYGLTIIKIAKKITTSGRLWTFNATFEPPNHAFDHLHVPCMFCRDFSMITFMKGCFIPYKNNIIIQ
jgi:hypothetical protein